MERVEKMKKNPTKYPGAFYREAVRIGGPGLEKVFYIVFKRDGKTIEEKVGRQHADAMTEAKPPRIRAERIENRRQSWKEIREERKAVKWTIDELWENYKTSHPALKGRNLIEPLRFKFKLPSVNNQTKDYVEYYGMGINIEVLDFFKLIS